MEAQTASLSPIDYLLVGHIAQDLDKTGGRQLGGTVSFAGGMAHALGCRTGIVTSAGPEADLSPLDGIEIVCIPASVSTTFENRYTEAGRTQVLHHRANSITADRIPAVWRAAPLVHIGPLVDEIEADLADLFQDSLVGLTPQGWLRKWDADGHVSRTDWKTAFEVLPRVHATVLSIDDIEGDWGLAERWAVAARVLVVTEAHKGATFFIEGERYRLPAPQVEVVDPTGAGDLFAAAFLVHFHDSRDVLASGRFAIALASASVTRAGLASWPTPSEIQAARSPN